MSGSQIGGVVGGVIGAFWGGNWQLGYAIGSAIGGAIDPDVIKGPDLGDARQQTSQAGAPIPKAYGMPAPFAGCLIDGDPISRKYTKRERQGKGGPIQESQGFRATRAILVGEGEVTVVRIWRNGKLVLSKIAGDLIDADNATFASQIRIYPGSETQLPDPSLEAIHGVGNTPYYRGRCYVVIVDDDETQTGGAANQYLFQVASAGTVVEPPEIPDCGQIITYTGGESFPFQTTIELGSCIGRVDLHYCPGGIPDKFIIEIDGEVVLDSGYRGLASQQAALDAELASRGLPPETIQQGTHIEEGAPFPDPFTGTCDGPDAQGCEIGVVSFYKTTATSTATLKVYAPLDATGWQVVVDCPDSDDLPTGWVTLPDNPNYIVSPEGEVFIDCAATPVELFEPDGAVWKDIALDIASRTPCPTSKLSVDNMTDAVPGFLLARPDLTGVDYLRALCGPYFCSLPEYDGQLHAIRFGEPSVRTLTDDDFYEIEEEDDQTRKQQIEAPVRVSLFYPDPANKYVVTPQTANRSSPDINGSAEMNVQTIIPFSADQAMQIVDKMQKIAYSKVEGGIKRALPPEFMDFVPSDCFEYGGRRFLIEKVKYEDLMLTVETSYDRISDYGSVATGANAPPPEPDGSNLKGPSILRPMNLPRLRSSDASPGAYLAVQGMLDGWPGADIYLSADGGATEQLVMRITTPAVIGSLQSAIDADDTAFDVKLLPGGELSSVSDAQLAARMNGFAINSSGYVSEVGQFKTAVADSGGLIYVLSDITRGLLGSTADSHLAGESFVLLDGAVQFLPLSIDLAGKTLIFRAVTLGTLPANNATVEFVFLPQFTGPQEIEIYTNSGGEAYTHPVNGDFYYKVT